MSLRYSVPDAVREIITSNPHLYECMKMKVLNYNAVASLIKQDVERIVGRQVNQNTIVAALVRFANSIEEESRPFNLEALRYAKISLTTGISDVTIKYPEEKHKEFIRRISEILEDIEADFANLHQFPNFAKLILSSDVLEKIRNEFQDMDAVFGEGFARITIRLPREVQEKSSIMDYIVDSLSREGIEGIDGFFGGQDIVILVRESDASRAFEALRKKISGLMLNMS